MDIEFLMGKMKGHVIQIFMKTNIVFFLLIS